MKSTILVLVAIIGMSSLNTYAQSRGKVINLPPPQLAGRITVEEAINRRRSIRNFRKDPLDLKTIGQILWAAQGVTDQRRKYRAAPSAGATYPLETYVATPDGLFHYQPNGHFLRQIKERDMRSQLSAAAYGQKVIADAPLVVIFCAEMSRTVGRYEKRGEIYVHMEAGHAAENIHLQAVALDLGSVPVGAFRENELSGLLNLPVSQTPLYMIPVGRGVE